MKSVFTRPLAFALCTALLAADLSASPESEQAKVKQDAATSRRRAVRTVDPNAVVLVGTVKDAATGAPIFGALITVGQRWGRAGRDGTFRISRGLAAGGVSATIERWGYFLETRNVALVPGTNTLNVTMTSKSKVTVTTTSGAVNRLDFESSFFSDFYPFQGLLALSPIELCTFSGSKSSAEKENFQLITFTGQKVANNNCCANLTTGYVANVTLKSGTRFDAIIVNSCTAYNMGFHGGNHGTGDFTNYPLSQITRIEFP